jgi:DNA-binding CsgD family transcriptional regulator
MSSAGQVASKVLPSVLAGVKHGSHLCAFYETKDDLIDLVLPFFAGGAKRGDACVWMMPDSVSAEEAALHGRAAVAESGIELYAGRKFYLRESHFEREPVESFWNEKLPQALDAGHSGVSASGDAFWLQPSDWNAFLEYEAYLSKTIADKPITLLCTYPLSASKSGDIFDVACAHHFAIAKRKKRWEVIKGWGEEHGEERVEPLDAANRILSLSRRERQVLDGLIEGRLSKTIANDLGISARTVDVHRARLLDRLNVRTTAEAVRLMTLASLITSG